MARQGCGNARKGYVNGGKGTRGCGGMRGRSGGIDSLGNRKKGAEGRRGGEPGKRERTRGGTGRNAGKGHGLRRLSIRRGK